MKIEIIEKRRKHWLWFPIGLTLYSIVKTKEGYYELHIKKGLLSERIEKIKLCTIKDIVYLRTVGNFFCGVACIEINTIDRNDKYVVKRIRKARQFVEKLEELVSQER